MRITEQQIRRLVREVLSQQPPALNEWAKNWDEYVAQTDPSEGDPDLMKSLYIKIVNSDWDKHVKDGGELLKQAGFEAGQGDSYKDYENWYYRFNDSPAGKSMRDPDGDKWTTPKDVLETLSGFATQIDSGEVAAAGPPDPQWHDNIELPPPTTFKGPDPVTPTPAPPVAQGKTKSQTRREKRKKDRRYGRTTTTKRQFDAADLDGDGRLDNSELQKWQSGGGRDEFEKNK